MARQQNEARERLIEGTRELLWDRGYVGISPAAILQRSGVGQGSMYYHFQGKPDLVLAAEQRMAAVMQDEIRSVFSGTHASAFTRISAYLLRQRDILRGCRIGRLTADPEVIADETFLEPVRETFALLHGLLTETIEEGKAAGEFAPDLDAAETASTLAAVIQGGYVLARAEQSVEPYERAVRGALTLLRASASSTAPVD